MHPIPYAENTEERHKLGQSSVVEGDIGWGVQVRNLNGSTLFVSTASRPNMGSISLLCDGNLRRLKWQRREPIHPQPASTDVKNGGAIPLLLLIPSWIAA
jgi:hypothetical protein